MTHGAPLEVEADRLAYGIYSRCAIDRTGDVWCFGDSLHGELGRADVPHDDIPRDGLGADRTSREGAERVPGLSHVVQLANDHSAGYCAREVDGDVLCWGTELVCSTAVQPTPRRIEGLPPAIAIAGGHDDGCAIDGAGTVRCWGCGAGHRFGVPTSDPVRLAAPVTVAVPVAVEAFVCRTCVRDGGGDVHCWSGDDVLIDTFLGDGFPREADLVPELHGASALVTIDGDESREHAHVVFRGAVVLFVDGSVRQWGELFWPDGSTSDLRGAIVVERDAAVLALNAQCILDHSGRARCWGRPGWTVADAVADFGDAPTDITPGRRYVSFAARWASGCAVSADGALTCWGRFAHPDVSGSAWPPIELLHGI